MKKRLTLILSCGIVLLGSSAFVVQYNSGVAGKTGAPGENTCSECHGGGSSAASSISISSTPSFTNNEYIPGTTYTMQITVSASGFNNFGFGCEILTINNTNAGTMQNQGPGVKFLNAGAKKNAVHTTKKNGVGTVNFGFQWVAPQSGQATIYVAANAVNNNGQTNGDFPLAPVSLVLTPGAPIDPVGLTQLNQTEGFALNVFPNPASDFFHINFNLKEEQRIEVLLFDLNGKLVDELLTGETCIPGKHSKILNAQHIAPGVYFLRINGTMGKLAQKMVVLN